MPTKYFVTGGGGNLTCQLTHLLPVPGDQIVLFDIAERPVAPVAAGCRYVQGDVTSPQDVSRALDRHRPEWVLHMASLLSGASERDRRRAWQVNLASTFELLEAMLARGLRRIFFPSSLASYGVGVGDPLPEDAPQWPTGLYGMTKVACERLGVYCHERHGIDFRCLRLPIVLSPHTPAGAASSYASRAFVESATLGAYAFPVNPTTRASMMYVADALAGIVRLVSAPEEALSRRVYNIHSISPEARQIAAAIQARLPAARLTFAPDPLVVSLVESWPGTIIDDSSRRDWGWQPEFDLDRLAAAFLNELGVGKR